MLAVCNFLCTILLFERETFVVRNFNIHKYEQCLSNNYTKRKSIYNVKLCYLLAKFNVGNFSPLTACLSVW